MHRLRFPKKEINNKLIELFNKFFLFYKRKLSKRTYYKRRKQRKGKEIKKFHFFLHKIRLQGNIGIHQVLGGIHHESKNKKTNEI